jgi:fucose permease
VKELALVSLFFFGAFLFFVYPSFQSFVGDDIQPKNQAQAFSLAANVQMVTGAIVVLVNGFLSDRFGINSPFLLVGALGAAVSVFYQFKRSVLAKKLSGIRL